ncbi:MAG: glycoside hydrolase domain-containing protein [Gemmatimonadales bacterium]
MASLGASLGAPRLALSTLPAAAAELVDVPDAVSNAVERAAAGEGGSHVGFDTNIYPGDRAMRAWKNSGEYEWVGYYLPAPCHKDDTWSGTRARLVDQGWGLAVIYVGQQTWGRKLSPTTRQTSTKHRTRKKRRRSRGTMTRESKRPVATSGGDCSAAFVNAAHGRADARDAIARAAHEGFAPGTVIFLDVEYMDVLPPLMREYYRAWTQAVLADGTYRPGIYAHTRNAGAIYDDVNDLYDAAGLDSDPPFWIAGSGGFSFDRAPSDVGHAFASVWQGMLDVVRTHNGVKLPIDISIASAASPSLAQ